MTDSSPSASPLVVVTGANGLVGSAVCAALVERGARVRAVVRVAGTAPSLPGLDELVGDFTDPDVATTAVEGADSVVTTVHPMGSDRETQHRIGVEGTATVARAAVAAGAGRLVHISTAAVYDRSPQRGDVDETSALVDDSGNDYAVTKRDTELALGAVSGITRVLLRPPAILGVGETSVWNTLRPQEMREDEAARHAVPEASFAWVHVTDLAALTADLATGRIADSDDPGTGPRPGEATPLNVAATPALQRDYVSAVATALGVEPQWDKAPAWTGRIIATRAHRWGWSPAVDLAQALDEVGAGLRD